VKQEYEPTMLSQKQTETQIIFHFNFDNHNKTKHHRIDNQLSVVPLRFKKNCR